MISENSFKFTSISSCKIYFELIPIGISTKIWNVSALIQMCDQWLTDMDNGKLNGIVFLDTDVKFLIRLITKFY